MILFVENYAYPINVLESQFPEHLITQIGNGSGCLNFVGYYTNLVNRQVALVVPKIYVEDDLFLGFVPVVELATDFQSIAGSLFAANRGLFDYFYQFSLLSFMSIREFRRRNPSTEITSRDHLSSIVSNIPLNQTSYLEISLSLIDFFHKNSDMVMFRQALLGSTDFARPNWAKVIRQSTPIIQTDGPVYVRSFNQRTIRTYEDELFEIYFNVLYRLSRQFMIRIQLPISFRPNLSSTFEYKAERKLRRIRGNYFNDALRKLHSLLEGYFRRTTLASTRVDKTEYLLCSNYNIVFEDMVDKLLSDPLRSYDELKKQPDGKIADHVVKHDSLFQPDDIYYVGDSKYYKSSTVYSSKAIYKQHTYAKNIIQYNVNLEIESSGSLPELRYRDPLTEGYNFTPNFFVEAFIPKSHVPSSDQALIFDTAALPRLNRHFENRLFDRDTLATLSFKLSFPFALRAYLSNDAKGRQRFRNSALQEIRKSVRQYLNDNFDFFRIRPHASVKIFVEKHFYLLTGKIYQTSEMRGEVILALAKDRRPDAARILELLTPEADLLAFSPL